MVWKCKDGSLIPITIMSERHLRNCLNQVRNRIKKSRSSFSQLAPNGDMASETYEEEESGWRDDNYKLRIHLRRLEMKLEAELERRRLNE